MPVPIFSLNLLIHIYCWKAISSLPGLELTFSMSSNYRQLLLQGIPGNISYGRPFQREDSDSSSSSGGYSSSTQSRLHLKKLTSPIIASLSTACPSIFATDMLTAELDSQRDGNKNSEIVQRQVATSSEICHR